MKSKLRANAVEKLSKCHRKTKQMQWKNQANAMEKASKHSRNKTDVGKYFCKSNAGTKLYQ